MRVEQKNAAGGPDLVADDKLFFPRGLWTGRRGRRFHEFGDTPDTGLRGARQENDRFGRTLSAAGHARGRDWRRITGQATAVVPVPQQAWCNDRRAKCFRHYWKDSRRRAGLGVFAGGLEPRFCLNSARPAWLAHGSIWIHARTSHDTVRLDGSGG